MPAPWLAPVKRLISPRHSTCWQLRWSPDRSRKQFLGRSAAAPREQFGDYVVEIDGWDWSYSLSLNSGTRKFATPPPTD